jgi:hypothetical protein
MKLRAQSFHQHCERALRRTSSLTIKRSAHNDRRLDHRMENATDCAGLVANQAGEKVRKVSSE